MASAEYWKLRCELCIQAVWLESQFSGSMHCWVKQGWLMIILYACTGWPKSWLFTPCNIGIFSNSMFTYILRESYERTPLNRKDSDLWSLIKSFWFYMDNWSEPLQIHNKRLKMLVNAQTNLSHNICCRHLFYGLRWYTFIYHDLSSWQWHT